MSGLADFQRTSQVLEAFAAKLPPGFVSKLLDAMSSDLKEAAAETRGSRRRDVPEYIVVHYKLEVTPESAEEAELADLRLLSPIELVRRFETQSESHWKDVYGVQVLQREVRLFVRTADAQQCINSDPTAISRILGLGQIGDCTRKEYLIHVQGDVNKLGDLGNDAEAFRRWKLQNAKVGGFKRYFMAGGKLLIAFENPKSALDLCETGFGLDGLPFRGV
jgi:hypothetical protein